MTLTGRNRHAKELSAQLPPSHSGTSLYLAAAPSARHRPEFQTAAEKGKAVTELGAKGRGAADRILALWDFLDGRAKRSVATAGKTKRRAREAK